VRGQKRVSPILSLSHSFRVLAALLAYSLTARHAKRNPFLPSAWRSQLTSPRRCLRLLPRLQSRSCGRKSRQRLLRILRLLILCSPRRRSLRVRPKGFPCIRAPTLLRSFSRCQAQATPKLLRQRPKMHLFLQSLEHSGARPSLAQRLPRCGGEASHRVPGCLPRLTFLVLSFAISQLSLLHLQPMTPASIPALDCPAPSVSRCGPCLSRLGPVEVGTLVPL
jgi:hypothetical protein